MNKNELKIKCKSCRQYIPSHKMFLHEGFCQKNNLFCEHCDQVFLRKDYDQHILEISKNLSKTNKDSIIKRLKTDFKDFKNENYNNNDYFTKEKNVKKKSMKITIPIIEQLTIRKPIVIGPYGNILPAKNDDYLISLFNSNLMIKNFQRSPKYNLVLNTKYNEGLTQNKTNYNNVNYSNCIKKTDMNHINILNNNNIFNEKNSILIFDKKNEEKNNLRINILYNNCIENNISSISNRKDINGINRKNFSKLILFWLFYFYFENWRIFHDNIMEYGEKNSFFEPTKLPSDNEIYSISYTKDKLNINNEKCKNNIIINNNIITYNSNHNINKINNIFNEVQNTQNREKINRENKDNINDSKININEIFRNNTNTNIYYNRYLKQKENKIINNLENSSKKEPQDNISKIKYIKISGKHKEKKPKKGIIIKKRNQLLNFDKNNNSQNIVKLKFSNNFNNNFLIKNNSTTKKNGFKKTKIPLNKFSTNKKQKKVETIKLRFNDYIKEDIDESSLDEKNIIFIRNIKLASRKKYKGNLPIKQALRQRGKSQDNIIRKKNVKKKSLAINKNSSIEKDLNGFPEDTKIKI